MRLVLMGILGLQGDVTGIDLEWREFKNLCDFDQLGLVAMRD